VAVYKITPPNRADLTSTEKSRQRDIAETLLNDGHIPVRKIKQAHATAITGEHQHSSCGGTKCLGDKQHFQVFLGGQCITDMKLDDLAGPDYITDGDRPVVAISSQDAPD
jgi:hypothetical protein